MLDRVLAAMNRAAPNIYEGELHEMVDRIRIGLREVADTSQNVAIYIANGHGAWEAANANLFSRGDRALVLARRVGVRVDLLDFGKSSRSTGPVSKMR